ncbi:hypothetical protein JD844_013837 [Phrynosoma platyrhinos]|uniref:SCAN box domain-containing protein n=1 Tax=Phrynosoma platyrhinos TaxID=52577 RepID=A0ABQ7TN75_PHRPL|nr:hypothetical protein JD844_013837 [Phrynosoma platyrhinos]
MDETDSAGPEAGTGLDTSEEFWRKTVQTFLSEDSGSSDIECQQFRQFSYQVGEGPNKTCGVMSAESNVEFWEITMQKVLSEGMASSDIQRQCFRKFSYQEAKGPREAEDKKREEQVRAFPLGISEAEFDGLIE